MSGKQTEGPAKITAELARIQGPMGEKLMLAFILSGRDVIDVTQRVEEFRDGMGTGGFTYKEHNALAKEAFDFGDRLFDMAYRSVMQALPFGEQSANLQKHPTKRLRDEIDGLRKELEDATARLRTAETQRDELRRIFHEPIIVTGKLITAEDMPWREGPSA